MKKLRLPITSLIILLLMSVTTRSKLMAQTKPVSPILVSNADATDRNEGAMVPLADLLTTLEQHFEATFLFKDKVVRRKQVNTDKIHIGENTGRQLAGILDQLGLTYYQVDEQTYVLLPQATLLTEDTARETISGTVTDASTGEILPGVNILVKGTSTGASTDAEGQYELTVESLQDTLVVSYIGYQTQEVPIDGRTTIDVALQSQATSGEEIVVVGYGTKRREILTGSVSTVDVEDSFNSKPIPDVASGLQGEVPGLTIRRTTGNLGEESNITLRGIR